MNSSRSFTGASAADGGSLRLAMNKLPPVMNKLHILILSLFGAVCASTPAADFDETAGVTLFAFDSVAIPFSQNLRLEMRTPMRHPANPVLRRGQPGTPDAFGVQFYGSVIREGGKFRMWYVAFDDDTENKAAPARWRAAYAESRIGALR
jgi:hypothetical protein